MNAYGTELRYSPALGWLAWDGTRWCPDKAAVMALTKATVRNIDAEAADLDEAGAAAVTKWAKDSEAKNRLVAMVELAQTEPGIPVSTEELDTEPMALNVANGTLDLSTGRLRKHRREDLITKVAPVRYDPGAKAPQWEAFLRRILPSDDVRAYVKRAAGYLGHRSLVRQRMSCSSAGAAGPTAKRPSSKPSEV